MGTAHIGVLDGPLVLFEERGRWHLEVPFHSDQNGSDGSTWKCSTTAAWRCSTTAESAGAWLGYLVVLCAARVMEGRLHQRQHAAILPSPYRPW